MRQLKQECSLWNVWFTWLGLPLLAIVIGLFQAWWAGIFVLLIGILAQILYVKVFPLFSKLLGYGSVADVKVGIQPQAKVVSKVILYTANVCPFCPIVKRRLADLQRDLNFEMEEMDITFRQDIIKEKGFKSVPIIEANGRYWIGNATTAQLLNFLNEN